MVFKIDPTVTFELSGGRTVVLDAYELSQMKRGVFQAKGSAESDSGRKLLDWDVAISETAGFVLAKTGVQISASEAIAIWELADSAWAEKKRSWDQPQPTSPTSPPSTEDPRYSD